MKRKSMLHRNNEGYHCSLLGRMMNRTALFALLFFMLVTAMPAIAATDETKQKEGWQFGADLYGWMPGMGMKTTGGDNLKLEFDDILHNLEFTFMGGVAARNGRWSITTDFLTMELKGEDNNSMTTSVGPSGHEITVNADATVKMQSWVVTPAIGYSVVDTDKVRLDVIAGARYLWIKTGLELEVDGPLQPREKKISETGDVWDGIAGIRGRVNLNEKWYFPYYADIGTGESSFTWQALAGFGYKINKRVDFVAAYRYLYWNFNDTKVLDELDISGPLVGMKFQF